MDPEKDVFLDLDQTLVQDQDQNLNQNSDQESDQDSDQTEKESDPDSEEDVRIFNAWMRRCRGEMTKTSTTEEEEPEQEATERAGSRTERTGSRTERSASRRSLEPPQRMDRRASLPCPSALSSMTLSRLHVSTATPVTAKVLLRRSSSRRLLPSPQEVPPPPGERERRGSLAPLQAPPTILERPAPEAERPASKAEQNKTTLAEKRSHFRRRNVMSMSAADSVCLICHNDLKQGTGGSRELQCSHTFHKECIEEHLWRRQQCPTCHLQVALPQTLLWSSTLNVP